METAAFTGATLASRYDSGFLLLEMHDGRVTDSQTFPAPTAAAPSLAEDSIVWLGCVSKPITAAAVMLLIDRRALQLDDCLARFFPALPDLTGSLSVRDLLAHRSGLVRNFPGWESFSFFADRWLSETLDAAIVKAPPPLAAARGRRTYSSIGYALLGALVEQVAAQEFASFVRKELFEPLAMNDTFCVTELWRVPAARIAPVLVRQPAGTVVAFDATNASAIHNSMPFAGFFSTTRDVARFLQMFLDVGSSSGGTILRESTVAAMLAPHTPGQGIHQALSWFLAYPTARSDHAVKACGFWHTSSSACLVAANTANRAAVVILGQTLLDAELMPVRVTEWLYVRHATQMSPYLFESAVPREAHRWLRGLLSTAPITPFTD